MSHIIKIFIIGFVIGVLLVFVATVGLIFGLVEFLKPILTPGTEMLRGRADMIANPLFVGLLLNGLIYGMLFTLISFAKKHIVQKSWRILVIVAIVIIFILITGMFADMVDFVKSPDKSWIFNIGA